MFPDGSYAVISRVESQFPVWSGVQFLKSTTAERNSPRFALITGDMVNPPGGLLSQELKSSEPLSVTMTFIEMSLARPES